MDRALASLAPDFRPLAVELLAKLTEAHIPVVIVGTRRSLEEQQELVRAGRSWTLRSKHLTGRAIDVAPFQTYVLHGSNKLNWDRTDPIWGRIAEVARRITGLKIGVVLDGVDVDPGHVELED